MSARKHARMLAASVLLVTLLTAMSLRLSMAQPLQSKLVHISDSVPGPVGLDYSSILDKLIVSVNFPTGLPNNFDTLTRSGVLATYSTTSGDTDEVYFTTVRADTAGGFTKGETYYGMESGRVGKINAAGTDLGVWLTLGPTPPTG